METEKEKLPHVGSERICAPAFHLIEALQFKHISNCFYLCTKHISIQLNVYDKDNHREKKTA